MQNVYCLLFPNGNKLFLQSQQKMVLRYWSQEVKNVDRKATGPVIKRANEGKQVVQVDHFTSTVPEQF